MKWFPPQLFVDLLFQLRNPCLPGRQAYSPPAKELACLHIAFWRRQVRQAGEIRHAPRGVHSSPESDMVQGEIRNDLMG